MQTELLLYVSGEPPAGVNFRKPLTELQENLQAVHMIKFWFNKPDYVKALLHPPTVPLHKEKNRLTIQS